MTVSQITGMREKRATAINEYRAVLAGIDASGVEMTAEQTQDADRREAEIKSLGTEIERRERLEGLSPNGKLVVDAANDAEPAKGEDRKLGVDSTEYRDSFLSMVAGGVGALNAEQRVALNIGTASQGGYLIPTDLADSIIASERIFGVVGTLANVINTSTGQPLDLPKNASHVTAAWVAEATAPAESESTFAKVTLNAYKYALQAKLSAEIATDSIVDLVSYLGQEIGQAKALLLNTAYVLGTGSSTPSGILDATVGLAAGQLITGAGTNVITTDELLNVFFGVKPGYRVNGSWVMNDTTLLAVSKLKDTTNQYLWAPGLVAGTPDTLKGRPVYTDPDTPSLATGVRSIIFGDFKRGYTIRNAGQSTVQRLDELFALTNQIGLVLFGRVDAKLTDGLALAAYKNA